MLSQPPIWLILIAFVVALGPLVFIHELGHYLVARWCGVGAETFSSRSAEITGWTDKRGTRWKVGWLPLGGTSSSSATSMPPARPATRAS